MKIALIMPFHKNINRQMPMGIAYLAAYLLKHHPDIEVNLLDATASTKREIENFLRKPYDCAGFTVTSLSYKSGVEMAARVKEVNPSAITIFGGPLVAILKEKILKENPHLDYLAYGEGELILSQLVSWINKAPGAHSPDKINGVIHRGADKIIVNPPMERIKDLNALPFPAFHLFKVHRYPRPYPMISSRGCPFQCTFCASAANWGHKWTTRSPENIFEEVMYSQKRFGYRPVMFHDDGFNVDMDRVEKLCNLFIEEKIKMPWSIRGFRADRVTPHLAKKIKDAGCTYISIGIESANPEVLKLIKKGETIDQITRGVRIMQEAGLPVISQFMVGNMGDTPETIKESIDYAKSMNFEKNVFTMAVPAPNTKLWHYAETVGRFVVPPNFMEFENITPKIFFETPQFSKEERLQALALIEKENLYNDINLGESFLKKIIRLIKTGGIALVFKIFPLGLSSYLFRSAYKIRSFLKGKKSSSAILE